jgi:hypothetical protein
MAACGSTSRSLRRFVLGPEWSEGRLRSLIGKGERTIRLPEKIPVHLTYFTLVGDDRGELHQIADLYAVNNKVRLALGLPSDGTRIAAEAKPQRQARPPRAAARPDRGAGADADVRASGLVVGDAVEPTPTSSGRLGPLRVIAARPLRACAALRPRIRHGSAQSSARDDRVGGLTGR